MPAPLYNCPTGAAVALAAATAKTVIGVKAHANSGILLKKLKLSFDGVTATAIPVTVEIGYCTWATNGPGTNSTSVTPVQVNGRVLTAGFTAGKTWTSEPTTITVVDSFTLAAFMGTAIYDIPLGDEYDSALGEGYVVRLTAAAIVNAWATLGVSRC